MSPRDLVLDGQDDLLQTPLHYATRDNNAEVIDFLLNNGANPTLLDHAGVAPFHKSIGNDTLDAFNMFIQHKVYVIYFKIIGKNIFSVVSGYDFISCPFMIR